MSITDIIILMIIRSAASADLPAIQRICGDVLDLEPDARNLPAVLANSESHLGVLAESQDAIIGPCYGSPQIRASAERSPDGLGA
jgi:hypothetical protein